MFTGKCTVRRKRIFVALLTKTYSRKICRCHALLTNSSHVCTRKRLVPEIISCNQLRIFKITRDKTLTESRAVCEWIGAETCFYSIYLRRHTQTRVLDNTIYIFEIRIHQSALIWWLPIGTGQPFWKSSVLLTHDLCSFVSCHGLPIPVNLCQRVQCAGRWVGLGKSANGEMWKRWDTATPIVGVTHN